jgi:cholesterol transport system auxiliary component
MRRCAPLLCCLLLAACAVGREELALRDVPLAAEAIPTGLARLDAQLHVDLPRASEPLGDVRIAIRDADDTYAVLPRVRWREPAPQLVQSLLLQALERCECLAGVARSGSAVHADYVLAVELRELAVVDGERDAAAVARLSLSLIRSRDGRLVAAALREQRVALATRSDAAGIAALARALNGVTAETVGWLHDTLARALPRSESK